MGNQQIHLVYVSMGDYEDNIRYVEKVFLSKELAIEYRQGKEKKMLDYKISDEYLNYHEDMGYEDNEAYDQELSMRIYIADDLKGYSIESYDIDDYHQINRDNVINTMTENGNLNI